MKYLIQNKKEFAISVGFFVMTAINLVRSIKNGELTEDTIVAFVLALFSLLAWYYNMPTSAENDEATFLMRQAKAEQVVGYVGEKFFDAEDDDEDFEDDEDGEEGEADDEE